MKTLKNITFMLALLATLGLVGGCGEESDAEEETPAADTPPAEETAEAEEAEPAAEEAPAEEAADEGGGDDSVCGRAQACCEAYVNALSANTPGLSVETTCASLQQLQGTPAADTSCQSAIDGWRQGLEAAQMEVPSDCAAQ